MYNEYEYSMKDVSENARDGLDKARKALARLIQNDDYDSLSPDDQSIVEDAMMTLRRMSNNLKRIG